MKDRKEPTIKDLKGKMFQEFDDKCNSTKWERETWGCGFVSTELRTEPEAEEVRHSYRKSTYALF